MDLNIVFKTTTLCSSRVHSYHQLDAASEEETTEWIIGVLEKIDISLDLSLGCAMSHQKARNNKHSLAVIHSVAAQPYLTQ